MNFSLSSCVCVCMCVWEGDRESQRVSQVSGNL